MNSAKVLIKQDASISRPSLSGGLAIVSDAVSELAEGPLWHQKRKSLFWVDILNNRLYEKQFTSGQEWFWQLPITASSIAEDTNCDTHLWLITEQGLCRFELDTAELENMRPLHLADGYRTNDGSVGPDGRYWFGTMLRKPESGCGQVFSINKQGNIKLELDQIAIPNTFCWLSPKQLLVTDSMNQLCNRYTLQEPSYELQTFVDLSGTPGTPDGGAVDEEGNVWIAVWGDSKVICVNPVGEVIRQIDLPVPQPSSCCFGGERNDTLFITTAKEGLSAQQLTAFPDSGKIFAIKLPVQGTQVKSFSMESSC